MPSSPAKIFLASSTAANETDTACRAISVSVRTFFATANACVNSAWSAGPTASHDWASAKASFTWPRIWGSPITIESRLDATRKACRTASPSANVYRAASTAVGSTPRWWQSRRNIAARASPGTSATA